MTSISFGGGSLEIPSSATVIDTSAFLAPKIESDHLVLIVGNAEGGEPQVLKEFDSTDEIRAHYFAGDLVDAAFALAEPSEDENIPTGAGKILCYKVNNGSKSSLTVTNTQGALAGSVTATEAAPYDIAPGEVFNYQSDASGGAVALTWTASAAKVTASGAPTTPMANETLVIGVNGGAKKTITFGTEANLAAIVSTINATLNGAFASDDGSGALHLESTRYGSSSQIDIDASSTALTKLKLTAAVTNPVGAQDAADLSAVTAAELKTKMESGAGLAVDITGTFPVYSSTTVGGTSSLTISASNPASLLTRLGLVAGTYTGAASGAAVNVIKFESKDWGIHNNGISVTMVDPAPASDKRVVTIKHTIDGNPLSYTSPTLGDKARLAIEYTGAAATATVTTTVTEMTLTSATGSESMTLKYTDYDTIEKLINQINTSSVWSASTTDTRATSFLGADLDWVTAISVTGGAVSFYSRVFDIVEWVNNSSNLITATRESTGSLVPDAFSSPKYLTGAIRGVSATSDWTGTPLQEAENVDCTIIIPLIAEDDNANGNNVVWTSVAAAYSQHVSDMNKVSTNQRERRLWMGRKGTKTDLLTQLQTLNSEFVSLCAERHKLPSGRKGTKAFLPEWGMACLCAGLRAGMVIGEPMTYKSIRTDGVEADWNLKDYAELVELKNAGLLISRYDSTFKKTRIVEGVTTYTKDSNAALRKEELITGLLQLSFDWRTSTQNRYLGRKGVLINLGGMVPFAHKTFTKYGDASRGGKDFLVSGVDANGKPVPGWDNVQVTYGKNAGEERVARMQARFYLVGGIEHILHTVYALPANVQI